MNRDLWWIPSVLCLGTGLLCLWVIPFDKLLLIILPLVISAILCAMLAVGVGEE